MCFCIPLLLARSSIQSQSPGTSKDTSSAVQHHENRRSNNNGVFLAIDPWVHLHAPAKILRLQTRKGSERQIHYWGTKEGPVCF